MHISGSLKSRYWECSFSYAVRPVGPYSIAANTDHLAVIMGMRVMAMYYNDRRIVLLVGGIAVVLLGVSIVFIARPEHTTVYRFDGIAVHLCHVASL